MSRILLKLSGEALAGDKHHGFDEATVIEVAKQVKQIVDNGTQVGIVIGGGNFWRGRTSETIDRTKADQIGMLATVMNCIYVSEIFRYVGMKTVWGQNSEIRDHHKELWVALKQEKSGRLLNIRFRLFNDGLGFRYEFPVQSNLRHFTLKEELTEFQLAGNHKAFWIPADYDTNEFQITTSRLSEVPLLIDEARNEPLACKSPTPNLTVLPPHCFPDRIATIYLRFHHTKVTVKSNRRTYLKAHFAFVYHFFFFVH